MKNGALKDTKCSKELTGTQCKTLIMPALTVTFSHNQQLVSETRFNQAVLRSMLTERPLTTLKPGEITVFTT